jgi:hypothetical protein
MRAEPKNSPTRAKAIQRILAHAAQAQGERQKRSKGAKEYLGYMVKKKDVLCQRWLREHGLPHSARVADIPIEPSVK